MNLSFIRILIVQINYKAHVDYVVVKGVQNIGKYANGILGKKEKLDIISKQRIHSITVGGIVKIALIIYEGEINIYDP